MPRYSSGTITVTGITVQGTNTAWDNEILVAGDILEVPLATAHIRLEVASVNYVAQTAVLETAYAGPTIDTAAYFVSPENAVQAIKTVALRQTGLSDRYDNLSGLIDASGNIIVGEQFDLIQAAAGNADRAEVAALAANLDDYKPTKAAATANLGSYVEGDLILVEADESNNGEPTFYRVVGGALVQGYSPATSAQVANLNAKLDAIPVFGTRNTTNATKAAGFAAGTVSQIDGLLYRADPAATGSASATNDLGVDGLVPHGPVSILHYGGVNASNLASKLAQAAVFCAANDIASISVPFASFSVGSATDMQGVGIDGENTTIGNTANLNNVGLIRRCIVRGYPTDSQSSGQLSAGGAHQKVLYRQAIDRVSVLMKRRGKGYIESEHWYDSFSSGSSDAGGNSERWRQCITRLISQVYVYKHTADDETASAWGASTNVLVSQSFPSGTAGAKQVQYRSTNTLDAEIAWNVEASKIGQIGFVGIYATGGSAGSVELYVNGVLQTTFSATLVGAQYMVSVQYALPQIGANEVRLKKVSGGSLNVIGAEFWDLESYPGGRTVEDLAYGDWDEDYVPGNGASDFALYSTGSSKFFGSVHGGETERVSPNLYLDGDTASLPTIGNFSTAVHIRWQSFTTIAVGSDSLDVDMTYTYHEDSYLKQDYHMSGSATVNIAYTAMSATSDRFGVVRFPEYRVLSEGKNVFPRFDTVTQLNNSDPNYPLSLTTRFNLYPMGGEFGANMGANGPYIAKQTGVFNKLYYGSTLDSEVTITSLSSSVEKIFE